MPFSTGYRGEWVISVVSPPSTSKTSAGVLMFRRRSETVEVLLVHPGGPFFRNKDAGAWSIPKGEAAPGEDLLARAQIEFEEELGVNVAPARNGWIALGCVKQRGGKTVHAWACDGDLPEQFHLRSNLCEIEWPPRSGRRACFPEIDRAAFFSMEEAVKKINSAQREFLNRLIEIITNGGS